ncbi:hypothetical protein K443DRAFT_383491 [Laccaria amethystina LaAM-08-1]|uniref:Uncharacterized protein n=1 Tax=Laccaria amethystina LaAM-08-1 TaxID=1095629 RepID=A0A0C9XBI9_9AGAR|nr:hypothetical protein K443DRAFT_383491 [Laccaria amethystina LaAM-08-1]
MMSSYSRSLGCVFLACHTSMSPAPSWMQLKPKYDDCEEYFWSTLVNTSPTKRRKAQQHEQVDYYMRPDHLDFQAITETTLKEANTIERWTLPGRCTTDGWVTKDGSKDSLSSSL